MASAVVVASSVACTTVFAASADQGAAAASPAAASDAIEEIVVTAERREETVQKSSVPIQVITGEGLERSGVTQSTDLNRIALQDGDGPPLLRQQVGGGQTRGPRADHQRLGVVAHPLLRLALRPGRAPAPHVFAGGWLRNLIAAD